MTTTDFWRGKAFSFFRNDKCEAFPCHQTNDKENFNCLFCYCPLYILGASCGGNFTYTMHGDRDCSACALPHSRDSYGYVTDKLAAFLKETRARGERQIS